MSFSDKQKEQICREYYAIHYLLEAAYGWNESERMAWLDHENQQIDDIKPMTMIHFGQTKELLRMLLGYAINEGLSYNDKKLSDMLKS